MMSYTSIDTKNDRWQTIFVSVYETIFVRNYNCQKWCLSETIFVKNDICVYVRISYMSEYRLINTNHICQKRYWSETIIVRNHNCQKRYLSGTIFVRNDICQCLFTHVCDTDVVYGKDICDGETVDGDSLQHTATHYNTLQHTATHGNTLQHETVDGDTRKLVAVTLQGPLSLYEWVSLILFMNESHSLQGPLSLYEWVSFRHCDMTLLNVCDMTHL